MADDPNTEIMARMARMDAARLRPNVDRSGRTVVIETKRRKLTVVEKGKS